MAYIVMIHIFDNIIGCAKIIFYCLGHRFLRWSDQFGFGHLPGAGQRQGQGRVQV